MLPTDVVKRDNGNSKRRLARLLVQSWWNEGLSREVGGLPGKVGDARREGSWTETTLKRQVLVEGHVGASSADGRRAESSVRPLAQIVESVDTSVVTQQPL